jgi:hypothetical protein
MLKRLIEVALPLKEVSEQSAREKSIRHGRRRKGRDEPLTAKEPTPAGSQAGE